jgi:hypothetical protein
MSVIAPSSDPRGERGISMFLVVVAMLLTSMFVIAGFAAAGSDFSTSAGSKARKGGYAAAEAGLAYYVKQLRTNPDFWAQCDAADAPNSAEASPINQQWDGGGADDPRKWRSLPSISAEYTIELLHTPKFNKCDRDKQESLVDMSTGTFKVRVTGREYKGAKKGAKRSLIATFKRSGFLKFVYFTDQENRDPQADTSASNRTSQQANCVNRKRSARAGRGCVEIQFTDNDAINGPLHTNDESVLVCGSPRFGRETLKDGSAGRTDSIEVSGAAPGYVANGSCTATPKIFSPNNDRFAVLTETMDMPESNQELVAVATSGGRVYSGRTIIHLKNNSMDVTNYATGSAVTQYDVSWPGNGVLYVANNGACNGEIPTDANYDESNGCGNVYVSGTYSSSLTIAAANDVIVRPTIGATLNARSSNADIIKNEGSDAVLGLIANNFVRVGHKVNRGSPCTNFNSTNEPTVVDVRIDAAIMSLGHSFMVDNYDCGRSGDLTVNGAIVQRFRGPVGTGSGATINTGYLKDYWYDDRLRFRSPPYFLNPLKSKWEVIQEQEQVPAR